MTASTAAAPTLQTAALTAQNWAPVVKSSGRAAERLHVTVDDVNSISGDAGDSGCGGCQNVGRHVDVSGTSDDRRRRLGRRAQPRVVRAGT